MSRSIFAASTALALDEWLETLAYDSPTGPR